MNRKQASTLIDRPSKSTTQTLSKLVNIMGAFVFGGLIFVSSAFSQTTVFTYSNPNPIEIVDNSTASVYPSEITVDGVNPAFVRDIRVSLNGFAHTFPDDVDIILVGPTGAHSVLMSDAGGGTAVDDLDLFFINGAATLPNSGELTFGIYDPANYVGNDGANDVFPSPGPGSVTGSASLAVFNGTDPNGVWNLFVVDDEAGDIGEITGGWSLFVVVNEVVATVTKTEDTEDGTCDTDCSLREAIASGANTINFSTLFDTPQTITLNGNEIFISNSVKINGPGADKLSISGNNTSRIFNMEAALNVSLDGITVRDGNADIGGGIDNSVGTLIINNSTISNNSATFGGGGIGNNHTLIVNNSTISNNSADAGGGIADSGISSIITNSTISNNSANDLGGGISIGGGVVTIANSTVSNNSANNEGGGIWNFNGLRSRNTIIANNAAPTAPDISGTFTSQGYNLIEDTTDTTIIGDTTGNQTGVDPMLAPLGDYGGPTQTHVLLPGSPAIDAGCATPAPSLDQRGFPRIDDPSVPSPAGCGAQSFGDIGAVDRHPDDFSGGSPRFDLDGDGKTDIGIFRPGPGEWWYLRSGDGGNNAFQFGQTTDKIVPADFSGDGKTDIAFWRESTGEWFVLRSEDSSFFAFPFGTSGDIPAPGDFDGDGIADPAVFRPSNATWYYIRSSDGGSPAIQFGSSGDVPIVEDYDGDGMDDIAVYRPSVSEWFLNRSTAGFVGYSFGAPGNATPAPADFTGDGTADIAFFNENGAPGTNNWFVLRSDDESFFAFPFGVTGDIPIPGDYDGDGTADPAVFRPSSNSWFLQQTTDGFEQVQFGIPNDIPIPSAYVP